MEDRETKAVNDALAGFVNLAAATFAGHRFAVLAEDLAERCAPLADLAEAVVGNGARSDVAAIRRHARALCRHSEQATAASAAAAAALAAGAAVHARAIRPSSRRRSTRAVQTAVRQAAKALDAARHDAGTAGRLAAGMATVHEPSDGPELLWKAALSLLTQVPINGEHLDDVPVTLIGGDADRRTFAGLLVHVGLNRPGLLVAQLNDGSGRYVQLLCYESEVLIESVSDAFLDPSGYINDEERAALHRLGFEAPDDDHLNWYRREDGYSAGVLADLFLTTLAEVHGAEPGDVVGVRAALAVNHPDSQSETTHEAVVLALEAPDVVSLAQALAERIADSISVLGVDRIWATVEQPDWPYFAHLGSNLDGGLFTEVTGNFYLDPENRLDEDQDRRLRALGWEGPVDDPSDDPEIQPRNYTRVWPAPFDLRAACWHVALTLVAVYGLDPEDPVLAEVTLF